MMVKKRISMDYIQPKTEGLLTDLDVEYSFFHCCGDEDLVFLKCPSCGHIWVDCFECSTWYVDLTDLDKVEGLFLMDERERLSCPKCKVPFKDYYYLMDEYVDAYLPTAEQVIDAGLGKYLSASLREKFGQ
jgi:uncharacterized C2H2 Zn-finger protein